MKQQLQLLTLGVNDFFKMKKFYMETFGWIPMSEGDDICFFKVNGMMFSIYPKEKLAEDIGIINNHQGFKALTMAILFSSESEVDHAFSEAVSRGAIAVKHPVKAFWGGYSSYVSDPEDNYWELAFNPFVNMTDEGMILK